MDEEENDLVNDAEPVQPIEPLDVGADVPVIAPVPIPPPPPLPQPRPVPFINNYERIRPQAIWMEDEPRNDYWEYENQQAREEDFRVRLQRYRQVAAAGVAPWLNRDWEIWSQQNVGAAHPVPNPHIPVPRNPNINQFINQIINNEEIRERHMNYDQLVRRYPSLVDRYLPDLSNKANALSALRSIESDRNATLEEKTALRDYVGNHEVASVYNYQWCVDCESMVGHPNHTHCPHCIYPCTVVEPGHVNPPSNTQLAVCGFCGECCRSKGHRYCPTCNTHSDRLCRHCSKCTACCACQLCPARGCQEMQECNDCCNCLDHCTCPALQSNGTYGKSFPAFKKKERRLFDCQRLAGVEWEYNRLSTQRYFDHWVKKWLADRHQDDSCGYEAVTAPIAGDYMVKCIEALGKVFEKSKASIDNRCSIHVHADAKDLQWSDMFRLLKVYSIVEPVLYMLAGQERLDNRYCVPCGKDYAAALERIDRKDAVMAVAFTPITRDGRKSEVNLIPDNGRNSQRAKPGKRADNHAYCRRKGLNILPWLAGRGPRPNTPVSIVTQANDTIEKIAQRNNVSIAALMRWNKIKPGTRFAAGQRLIVNKRIVAPDTTVEFRIHPNTHDANRVINWVKVILRLVDWAAKSTDNDLEKLPKSALRILCQVIAPECAPWIMSRVQEWRKETSKINGRHERRISLKGGKYSY